MSEKTLINRALLLQTLEQCGADPKRWPDETRAGLKALITKDPLAQSMTDESVALDRLITKAGEVTGRQSDARNEILVEKIMQSVGVTAEPQLRDDTVVPFESARRRAQSTKRTTRIWPDVAAAGALAASLLLGISIGASGVANSTLAPVSEVLGLGPIATETAALSDPVFDDFDDHSFDDDVL